MAVRRTTDIQEALERRKSAASAIEKQAQREKEDLSFQTSDGMWPEEVKQTRRAQVINGQQVAARPMLSVATLDEPLQLTLNQFAHAHLGVDIAPISEDATDDTAEVIQDLYREIENVSRADIARSWGFDRSTKCGRGCYRIDKVYDPYGGHPLDQKLVFKRILNQGSVLFDMSAEEPDWCDGMYAFVDRWMTKAAIKRRWPKAKVAKYTDAGLATIATECPDWFQGDSELTRMILVTEYWRVEITTEINVLLDDNSVAPENAIPEGRTAKTGDEARSVPKETRRVFMSPINAVEELDQAQEWDGEYIPLIPVIYRELQPFDNERRWVGMIGPAKDGARLTNYAASGAVEMAALEPKAPWMADARAIEGYEQEYQQSNIRNLPVLHYKAEVDGRTMEKPERVHVDMSRMGPNMQLLSMGRDFVQSATSTFDPALGKQPTAHRSGRALIALQDQSVEATSHGVGNMKMISMPYEAKVMLDLIPRVYDRPGRIEQIRGEDNKTRHVLLNAPFTSDPTTNRPLPMPYGTEQEQAASQAMVADPQHPAKQYDLNKGRYGVTVSIGKGYDGRLAEGDDAIGMLLQADPALMPILGPEWLRFKSFPGAKKLADMLEKMRDHTFPFLKADGTAMDPAQLAQENAMLKQQLAEAAKAIETDAVKAHSQQVIAAGKDATNVELHRMDNETKIAVAELGAKVDRITLFLEERARLGIQDHEAAQAEHDRAHDTGLAAQDHQNALDQQDQAHAQTMDQQAQAAALAPEPAPSNGSGA